RALVAPVFAVARRDSVRAQAGRGISRPHAVGYRLAAPEPEGNPRRRRDGRQSGRDRAFRAPAPGAPRRQPVQAVLRMDRLKDKVAIVTGAGSVGPGWGNGRAIAARFAEEGAKIFAVD